MGGDGGQLNSNSHSRETIYIPAFPIDCLPAMLAVVIVLLLLTALVATEPSSPGGGD
ncbi:MAG: hypothetical protein ACREF9_03200 [Opitutaceae bacterium]